MRIAVDCRCVFDGCGGIGNYARSLVRALARVNDYDEVIVLRTSHRPGEPIVEAPNVWEERVRAAMLDADWEQLQLPALLEELGVDLYHNTTFALPMVAPCRTVTTIHDVVFQYRPDLVSPSLREYLARWSQVAAHTADRVITVSRYSKHAVQEAYGVSDDRIDVTYEAADLERFYPRYGGGLETEFRKRYGIEKPFVLYVGALEPKKNIDNLLAAFRDAKRMGNMPHQLVLAGGKGGMEYDIAEAVSAFGVGQDAVVTGYLPGRYLPVAYNAADVFVYPSLYEGFGLPPLEAMACGTPTIVARATSLPEVVGEAALSVNPYDVSEMAEALYRVVQDEGLREAFSRKGIERARMFSWQRTALDTLESYRIAAA